MKVTTNEASSTDLLIWKEPWIPNFNKKCKAIYKPNKKMIVLKSRNASNVQAGLIQDVILEDNTYSYLLSCDMKIKRCKSNHSTSPCGAYIAVFNNETTETTRTQRYTAVTSDYIHLKLPFLVFKKGASYRIGVYVDGACHVEFSNIRLEKNVYHGHIFEEESMMM